MKPLIIGATVFIFTITACNNSGRSDASSDTTANKGQPGTTLAGDSIPGAGNTITPGDSSNPKRDTEVVHNNDSTGQGKDSADKRPR